MEKSVKIIIGGLDNAGKTSIITALNKKYDFHKDIMEIKPTIKVEYHKTSFLNRQVNIWDCGGQEEYRKLYLSNPDIYFSDTDLLVYIIDIQDKSRYDDSLKYLDDILQFFIENHLDVPMIISFHKYDNELRGDEEYINRINELRERISSKYPDFKILYQSTSIYDIISITQLISYGLSVFDEHFFDLSELLEDYIEEFKAMSLILFDANAIIIGEFYSDSLSSDIYIELLESIKEHLFLLKRLQEERYDSESNFFTIEKDEKLLSFLHRITISDKIFYLSILIKEENEELFLEGFADFMQDLKEVISEIV